MDHEVRMPGPRAHLSGTLSLLDRFAGLTGIPVPPSLHAFLDRALPPTAPPARASLKYDVYLAAHRGGRAWGVAVNDRYEAPGGFDAAVARLLSDLGVPPPDPALTGLLDPGFSTVCALGLDAADSPPRVKIYLQEPKWGRGVAEVARLRTGLPGLDVPDWLGDRRKCRPYAKRLQQAPR